ncbi:MAG: hypothetical protein AAFY36_19435 [Bacteroidota bacterium]
MDDEVLDYVRKDPSENRKWIKRLFCLFLLTIFFYIGIEIARGFLPVQLSYGPEIRFNVVGSMILIVIVINSLIIPTFLSKIQPEISLLKIVGLTGAILFGIEFMYRLAIRAYLYVQDVPFDMLDTLLSAMALSFFGSLISNLRIHSLRGRSMYLPVAIFLFAWIVAFLVGRSVG